MVYGTALRLMSQTVLMLCVTWGLSGRSVDLKHGDIALTLDLHQVGLADKPRQLPLQHLFWIQLSFIEQRTLAVSFATVNDNPTLSDRSNPQGGALLFKTVFLDAGTGEVKNSRVWGDFTHYSRLFPLRDGKFLLERKGQVQIYSEELIQIAQRSLPKTDVWRAIPYAGVVVSTSGGRIYIYSGKDKEQEEYEILDSSDLTTKGSFLLPQPCHGFSPTASDDAIVTVSCPQSTERILLHEVGSPTKVLYEYPPFSCTHTPSFLGAVRIAVSGCSGLQVFDLSGKELLNSRLDKDREPSLILPSRNGDRFLVYFYKWRGGSSLLDMSPRQVDGRVRVFDSQTLSEFYNSKISYKVIGEPSANALSPDGSKWCYVEGFMLRCVALKQQ